MTTVVETLQAAASALGDPTREGEAVDGELRASFRLFGADGPVVVLVDAPDDLTGWSPRFVAALCRRGLRVLRYDAHPPPPRAEGGARLLAAVLDAAGVERAHIVGASAGGLVAQAFASEQPGRAASLTLLMSRLPTARAREVADAVGPLLGAPEATTRSAAITRHNTALSAVAASRPEQRSAARRRASSAFGNGADPVSALRAFAEGRDGGGDPASHDIPTLVFHGLDDPLVGEGDAAALVAAWRGRLVAVAARHELPWGAEEAIADRLARLAAPPEAAQPAPLRKVAPAPRRRLRWPHLSPKVAWTAAAIALLLSVSLVVGSSMSVPYYAIQPGLARQTNDLVEVPSAKRFPPKGEVLFVTVGLVRLRAFQYLLAKQDDDVDVVPEELILGKSDPRQYQRRSTQAMVDSKETAAVVALQRLCLDVQEKGTGARIQEVVAGSPAEKAGIRAEDTIVAVDGKPVTTAEQALAPLRASKPGAPFRLTLVGPAEGAQPRDVSGILGSNPNDPKRSFLGIVARTRSQDFVLPFDVNVESGRVGGPSAGLAFTLALLDQLTPGELTGGGKVAATGTIELDGSVGLVGGVPQKAVAVRRSGAKLFLVPSGELEEARKKIGKTVEVVAVDTLEQAIQALAAHGGDTSGIPASCPGR